VTGLTLILRRVNFSGNTWALDGSQKAVGVAVVGDRMWDRSRSRSILLVVPSCKSMAGKQPTKMMSNIIVTTRVLEWINCRAVQVYLW
jgi:hypothetical protein